jgi:hypothetical protein
MPLASVHAKHVAAVCGVRAVLQLRRTQNVCVAAGDVVRGGCLFSCIRTHPLFIVLDVV